MMKTPLSQRSSSVSDEASSATLLPAAILSLVTVLLELIDFLATLSEEEYRTKPAGPVASSIGGHVRHCLDHVESLLVGIERGTVNYDQRQRGTEVETCRRAALAVIDRQIGRLRTLAPHTEHQPLRLLALVSSKLEPLKAETTVGRELVFVLSHTIHHNALVAVMARALGVRVPDSFGYAPSTLTHLENAACVR